MVCNNNKSFSRFAAIIRVLIKVQNEDICFLFLYFLFFFLWFLGPIVIVIRAFYHFDFENHLFFFARAKGRVGCLTHLELLAWRMWKCWKRRSTF
jgi:hypothetical protein